jgi:hypothetical protein
MMAAEVDLANRYGAVLQVLGIVVTVTFFLAVCHLIRRGKLNVRYSLLWLIMTVVFLPLAIRKDIIDRLSPYFGIHNPPFLLFLLAFLFLLAIVFHFSAVLTELMARSTALAQELALVKKDLAEACQRLGRADDAES